MPQESPDISSLSEQAVVNKTSIYLAAHHDYDKNSDSIDITVAPLDTTAYSALSDNDRLVIPVSSASAAMEIFEYARQIAAEQDDPDMVQMMVKKKIREVHERVSLEQKKAEETADEKYRNSLDTSYQDSAEINGVRIEVKWVPGENGRSKGGYKVVVPEAEGEFRGRRQVNSVGFASEEEGVNSGLARELFEAAVTIFQGWGKHADPQELFRALRDITEDTSLKRLRHAYHAKAEVNGIQLRVGWQENQDCFTIVFPYEKDEWGEIAVIRVGAKKADARQAFDIAQARAKLISDTKELERALTKEFEGLNQNGRY